jgi:putative hydrolase of the HAD superfamily
MIRNIVFDLGNVLISFRPSEYLKKNHYPEKTREKIINDIFLSSEWLMLDNGKITREEAVDSIARKSSLKREEIALIFNKRVEIMFPLDNNVSLLPGLKERGFKLFYLSNFPLDIFDEIKHGYAFFKYFDGGIISSEVKYSKPGIEIYQIFFKKYKLKPEESLFIDDIEANVRAAEKTGMKGIHLLSNDSLNERFSEFGLFKIASSLRSSQ